MSSWLGTAPLVAGTITLRPTTLDDAEALGQVVSDPAKFVWSTVPVGAEAARQSISDGLADPEWRVAYAVVDNETGALLGTTSYYDIDPANLSLSIGYTFYADDVQGTTVNPTAKYLLLHHAFEECGAVRVVWHTNERNARSRAAIAKLGARYEGVLRKHRRFGDGWRTTAQYAMIDDDWPEAKARLLARM